LQKKKVSIIISIIQSKQMEKAQK